MSHNQEQQDYERAIELLKAGHVRRAERIADSLIDRRFSGGFEVKARCLDAKGEHDDAIALLEGAVRLSPSVCLLWDYLGEYYSNAGRYVDALAAFQQSRNVGGDPSFANCNLAITYGRMGEFETAKQLIGDVGDSVDARVRLQTRAWIMAESGELGEALAAADGLLTIDPATAAGHGLRALVLQRMDRPLEARAAAMTALAIDKTEEAALEALCLQNPACTCETRIFEVLVLAKPKPGIEPFPGLRVDGYFKTVWAAAKSAEEALRYYREISGDDHDYTAQESSIVQEAVEGHEGVWRIDRMTFSYSAESNLFKRIGLMVQARRYRPPN
jgi:tetratricopeptide (TPR) repeat protein